MKSNAPWSVKGIERDARETAKEAARREGMTVGEWLNQMIYTAGETGGDAAPSGGEVEGLKLRDVVTAIEHLHKRIAEGHAESVKNMGEVSRKVGEVVERVQRLERVKPAVGTHDDLAARISRLEQDGGDRNRIDALKALEKAVAQVAVQFNNAQRTSVKRLDATERQLQEFAERLDRVGPGGGEPADAPALQSAIVELGRRVAKTERIAEEAAQLKSEAGGSADPDFIESTGNRLRVLGDEIKRGGDQIRTLETTIQKLSQQIDAAERRSAEGVQKVSETLAGLRENFTPEGSAAPNRADIDAAVAEANRNTEERIAALQTSFEKMIERLDSLSEDAVGAEGDIASLTVVETEDAHAGETAEPTTDTPMDFLDDLLGGDGDAGDVEEDDDATAQSENEPEAIEAAAPDDEDNEDPFAFADDINAEFNEDAADDDFDFELDEEPVSDDGGARSLLSEVKEAFGQKTALAPEDEAQDSAGEMARAEAEDDIDHFLANLDIDENEDDNRSAAQAAPPPDRDDVPADAVGDLSSPFDDDMAPAAAEPERMDQPKLWTGAAKPARPAQRGDGQGADANRPSRRMLTAKQKAILAARARRKRLAAMESEDNAALAPSTPKRPSTPAAPTPSEPKPAFEARDREHEEDHAAESAGKRSPGLFSFLPFVGKKADKSKSRQVKASAQETAAPPPGKKPSRNGDRTAFQTLKSATSARPVTLALAVAIVLSIGVLFLLVKDYIFKPTGSTPPAAIIAATPTSGPAAGTDADADAALEVPAPPAVDPHTLYHDAMAGLSVAATGSETSAAMDKLEQAAALGLPPAQLQLGEFYKTGQHVEQDLRQARTWFRRAATGGNVLAMHRIGVMTARGDGGPADTAEAIRWFEAAANYGLVDSQYNLGAIYHPSADGPSSIQDAAKAYYWYSLAAKNGDEQAGKLADAVGAALSPEEKRELDAQIASWEALTPDADANDLASD